MRRILRIGGAGAFIVFLFLSSVWANLAIAYQLPGSPAVGIGACLVLNLIALSALVAVVRRRHWPVLLIYAAAFALVLAWSRSIVSAPKLAGARYPPRGPSASGPAEPVPPREA